MHLVAATTSTKKAVIGICKVVVHAATCSVPKLMFLSMTVAQAADWAADKMKHRIIASRTVDFC